ncbi:MAG: restriction endonuclease subunit S, partial [Candidatus Absconditabacterales bacterium]
SIFLEMFGDLRTNEKKWDKKIFTDVVVLKRGHDLPIQDRMAGEYPVIASTNIVGYHNKYKAEGPGVVTGRSGTIGEVQYIEGNYWPLNTALYSESLKGNNPIYVAFYLRAFDLNRYVRGAGVPTLNRNLFNTELVPLPPFPLQQKFADIIAQIEAQKSEHKLALAKLEELYRAEMQRSFSL